MSKAPAFVYCWTDHASNMLYVGYHKGLEDDGYVCSSKWINEEYSRRPQDFTRQIIAAGSIKDCLMLETCILKSVDAKNNHDFYNMHNGDGKFIYNHITDATRKKMSDAKIRAIKNGTFICTSKGKHRSDDTKKKISAKNRMRWDEKRKQGVDLGKLKRGCRWFYDPVTLVEKQILPSEVVYAGWVQGRSPKTHHGGHRGAYTKERSRKFVEWVHTHPPGMQGKHHSDETKRKIGIANASYIRRPMSDDAKRKISAARVGKVLCESPDGKLKYMLLPLSKGYIRRSHKRTR